MKYDFSLAINMLDNMATTLEESSGLKIDDHGNYIADNVNASSAAAAVASLAKAISVLRAFESEHKEHFE